MNNNSKKRPILSGEYVKNYYNAAVENMGMPYSDFRWFSSSYAAVEYKQTKRVILHVLRNKKFDSVLEIGGGDGAWTEILLGISGSITEMDISERLLSQLENKFRSFSNINFINRDFLENHLKSKSYDLIYAIRSFEYLSDKETAVGEMHRLLKNGGEVLIVSKNPSYVSFNKSKDRKLLHGGQIGISDIKKLFAEGGFMILDIRPAILGKKFDLLPARALSNALHRLSNSNFGWLVPGIFKKYFSESYLIFAKKI